ncbi:AraC family transcriptional regulator [Streptomyces radicis]|uniref:AraC family transcriptional regulator n=1 Tax=Streptomyces radicis TaxID=1750517 RepID=A0A3A9WJI7_9ACTN|nr:helix-turn-helix transcriptional regulator [Streptomyces radicis]RKN07906.1 AraC family transcriptional regulator [Streptomyces radicis]RKN20640.1 AraC family transcriptional regulator [Streptomyces radicis]
MQWFEVRLDEPPRVVGIGVGVHGTASAHDTFRLPDLWQLHLYRYTARLIVGDTPYTIRPGHVSLVPPGTLVRYQYRGRSEHLYAHLRLPLTGEPRQVPAVQDAGAHAATLSAQLLQAIAAAPQAPARTTAEIWSALWRVAHLPAPDAEGGGHRAVAAAMAHIESRLAEPLTVPVVARAAGVSHNHLTRLFRAETGDTVVAHIRRRRMERAGHLLRATTLPIRSVAASVGIGDLQSFNKICRRELGASPRTIRAAGALPPTP